MLRIHFSWGLDYDLPEYDPEIHDPKEVFAMLCYRGVHYAKWVQLDTCLLYTSPSPRDS